MSSFFFFFNDTATTEIYTLSLHDALPISLSTNCRSCDQSTAMRRSYSAACGMVGAAAPAPSMFTTRKVVRMRWRVRSEEHTSELQSRQYLVCRLLLEKKKKNSIDMLC